MRALEQAKFLKQQFLEKIEFYLSLWNRCPVLFCALFNSRSINATNQRNQHTNFQHFYISGLTCCKLRQTSQRHNVTISQHHNITARRHYLVVTLKIQISLHTHIPVCDVTYEAVLRLWSPDPANIDTPHGGLLYKDAKGSPIHERSLSTLPIRD